MVPNMKSILDAHFAPSNEVLNARPKLDDKVTDELKINKDNLKATFNMLCKNWLDKDTCSEDCSGKRIVTSLLKTRLHEPLILSIMADDINNFKKHSSSSYDLSKFEFCCLSGAENIIRGVYLTNDSRQVIAESQNCMAYVLTSGKVELAKDLAKKLKSLGRTDKGPLLFYSFGQIEAVKEIEEALKVTAVTASSVVTKPQFK
jgi:hypothetical protein